MGSNYRSPVKDQLVETVLFDFPAEARKRTIGGRRSQPRDLGGDLRRDHNLRDDNDRLGWGRRLTQNGGSPDGGPMVRILFPPAASQVRTRVGVQALILILDNHEFFRQVGVAFRHSISSPSPRRSRSTWRWPPFQHAMLSSAAAGMRRRNCQFSKLSFRPRNP